MVADTVVNIELNFPCGVLLSDSGVPIAKCWC